MKSRLIIFTDLDGTLLDSRYSFQKAAQALELIKKKGIPLIFCSSKTRAEIEDLREKTGNLHPFISENGGGIFIPKKYFKSVIAKYKMQIEDEKEYFIIKLGALYSELTKALVDLRKEGFDLIGFDDMSVRAVADVTGLSMKSAKMAKERDFDEPFLFKGSRMDTGRLKRRIRAKRFNYTQGEFFHIMGDSDKGRAVEILMELFVKKYGKITSVALGDSPNDMEMLRCADYPVVIQKRDGTYHRGLRGKKFIRSDGTGPEGWNRAVIKLFETLGI